MTKKNKELLEKLLRKMKGFGQKRQKKDKAGEKNGNL